LLLAGLALLTNLPGTGSSTAASEGAAGVQVAGVQLEFPVAQEVPLVLDKLIQKHPEAQLLVLCEYTFDGPVPELIKAWCRQHKCHLIVGGKEPIASDVFYNTAFVIDPTGNIAFKQVKTVPIQFFKDGLPAPEQRVWESPWGRIGICICYDLCYTRVIDQLARQGAQAIIVPTMDVVDWGEHQHRLHSRIAPARAAEYGLPIFRLASSGISQAVERSGRLRATAPFGGEGEMLAAGVRMASQPGLPADRFLAPLAVALTLIVGLAGAADRFVRFRRSALVPGRARSRTRSSLSHYE